MNEEWTPIETTMRWAFPAAQLSSKDIEDLEEIICPERTVLKGEKLLMEIQVESDEEDEDSLCDVVNSKLDALLKELNAVRPDLVGMFEQATDFTF